jgi:hypothetical protein
MSFNSMVKRPKTLQPKSLRLLPTRIIGNVKEGETPSQNQDFNLG